MPWLMGQSKDGCGVEEDVEDDDSTEAVVGEALVICSDVVLEEKVLVLVRVDVVREVEPSGETVSVEDVEDVGTKP